MNVGDYSLTITTALIATVIKVANSLTGRLALISPTHGPGALNEDSHFVAYPSISEGH
jgi:hypothetical protein